jgi:hypothetical protein
MGVQDEPVVDYPEPQPLQARGVMDTGVFPGFPGDCLSTTSVGGLAELLDGVVDLVDRVRKPRYGVGGDTFVVGILPLAFVRVDPVVVDTVDDFLAICFKLDNPAREGAVDARLGERISDGDHGGCVAAGWVFRLIILGGYRGPFVPGAHNGGFPGLGKGIGGYIDNRQSKLHLGSFSTVI